MKFNLTYGPDIASAPDGFKATVEAVAAFFESTFTDPVTINVKVERGLSGGLLGHSDYTLTVLTPSRRSRPRWRMNRKAAATPSPLPTCRTWTRLPGTMPIT